MSKRILVTGINGFAATHLLPILQNKGYEIFGIASKNSPIKPNQYAIDLRSLDDVTKVVEKVQPNYVIHLAAVAFVGHSDVNEIYDTNIIGSRNLLFALTKLKEPPKSVLLVSSANVYGNSDSGFLNEDTFVNPVNDYAVSKIAMEYMARQFYEKLNIIIARPFNYTGRGQSDKFLIPKIVSHFKEKKDNIELGNIEVSRDFSDVRNIVANMVELIEAPQAIGNIYNLCSGVPLSLTEIINICKEITSHEIEIKINPLFIRANEIKLLVGDNKKIRNLIKDYEVIQIKDTIKWMLSD